jgi:carbon-monoxide dehydrogenase medium subunit
VRPFVYHRPESLADALQLLREHGAGARVLAGGTDLIVRLRKRQDVPGIVVDLKRVAELRADIVPLRQAQGVASGSRDGVRIGARTVISDIVEHQQIRERFAALVEAGLVLGSIQIRNRATLAGNLCNASPAADTAPALLVYGARVTIVGPRGTREAPLDEFLTGPGRTALGSDELVAAIDLPWPPDESGAAFARLTRRRGVDLAIVSVACLASRSGEIRFAFGAVGPRPFLVVRNEAALLESNIDPEQRDAMLSRFFASASPISDLRAHASYRAAMLPVVARRALGAAVARMNRGRGPR